MSDPGPVSDPSRKQRQRAEHRARGRNRYGRPRRTHLLVTPERTACGRAADDAAVAGYIVGLPEDATCANCQPPEGDQ